MSADEEQIDDQIILTIEESDREKYGRLDQYLADKLDNYSRTFLKSLFKQNMIVLDESSPNQNAKVELKKMPAAGTVVCVMIPPPLPTTAEAENIPLEILYEDEYLLFVNKPAGMVVHPAPGNYTGTLVNAILHHCPDLKRIGDQKRPGIVHRLDKGTSGVMVVAKDQKCLEGLVLLFSQHNIERVYECLAMGTRISPAGTIESSIGRHPTNRLKMAANVPRGKRAITHYKVLEFFQFCAHMQMRLETGRTHQIRVHLSELLRAPIVCDPTYGRPVDHINRLGKAFKPILDDYPHPLLHAKVLGLEHPITKENLRFEVPLPDVFQRTLDQLQKEKE